MSRLTRDEMAVSRNLFLRRDFSLSLFSCPPEELATLPAVDPYSAVCNDHAYIHTYIHRYTVRKPLNYHFMQTPSKIDAQQY